MPAQEHVCQSKRPCPSCVRHGQGGLTLIELIVGMAVSVIIIGFALESVVNMSRHLTYMEGESRANDEAKRLNDYLSSELVAVGGGSVRPWMAIWVEDDLDSEGSDRLSFAVVNETDLQCQIKSLSGNTIWVDDTDGCCLTTDFEGQEILAMSSSSGTSDQWANRHVDSVNITSCTLSFSAGMAQSLDHNPSIDRNAGETGAVLDGSGDLIDTVYDEAAYSDGYLSAISVRVLWVDHDSDYLMAFEDLDEDGVGEVNIVADRVLDLQISLGYDVAPWDWHISSDGTTADEWLFNASGDTYGASDGQGLASVTVSDLRMVSVGVVVGAPVNSWGVPSSTQVHNGPSRSRTDWIVRSSVSITGLRNYDIMR